MACCIFCLDTKGLVQVCLTCRTRLENAEREIVKLRSDLAARERQVFAMLKEKLRTRGGESRGQD